ncbi:MAG: hypothetical protein WBB64_10915 [Anaerolineales bacterium]
MNYPVPPSFDLEETSFVSFVGIGMREFLIVGSGLLLGIMAGVALPAGWPIKIAAGTMLAGFGLWLAIGREPGTNRKFEEVFLDFLRFRKRPKVHQRNYISAQEAADPFSTPDEFEYPRAEDTEHTKNRRQIRDASWDVSQLPEMEQLAKATGWFKIRAMPLTGATLLNILGLALLAGLLAWVWLGGLKSLLARFSGF